MVGFELIITFLGYQDEMIAGKSNHQGKVKNIMNWKQNLCMF